MELVRRIDLLWFVLFGTVLSVSLLLAVVVLNRKRRVDDSADEIEDIERRVEELESESGGSGPDPRVDQTPVGRDE